MGNREYRVSALLSGHTDDVRSLAVSPLTLKTQQLYSTSRDSSIRIWEKTASVETLEKTQDDWGPKGKLTEFHTGFINSSHAFKHRTHSYMATGDAQSIIQIWSLPLNSDSTPLHTLLGHSANICSLHSSTNGNKLISGSWDGTARIWSTQGEFNCLDVLGNHQGAVWDILHVKESSSGDFIITGSSNLTFLSKRILNFDDDSLRRWCSNTMERRKKIN